MISEAVRALLHTIITRGAYVREIIFGFDLCAAAVSDHGQVKPQGVILRAARQA